MLSPDDPTEDETVLQDTAAASAQSEQKPASLEPDTESHSTPKSETTSPPDVIPASDKIRSSPETVGNWSVTLTETNTTQNHAPTGEEKVTITTTEEILRSEDGGEVRESVETETRETVIVSKTTQQIVTSKTVETVVVNSEEVSKNFSFYDATRCNELEICVLSFTLCIYPKSFFILFSDCSPILSFHIFSKYLCSNLYLAMLV